MEYKERKKRGGLKEYDYSNVDPEPFFLVGNKSKIPNIRNAGQNRAMAPGIALCGAKKTGQDRPCYAAAMFNGRCKRHGGVTEDGHKPQRSWGGVGADNPLFEGGRWSRHMPKEMADDYIRALADPELIALRADQALLESRLGTLLERTKSGKNVDVEDIRFYANEAQKAFDEGDMDQLRRDLVELRSRAKSAIEDNSLWREIGLTIERRRKITDTEQKRVLSSQMLVSKREVVSVAVAIGNSLQTHAREHPEIILAVQRDLQRIFGAGLARFSDPGADDPVLRLPGAHVPGDDPESGSAD